MTERLIPFSAPMVRAILAGTKTKTRRIVKPKRLPDGHWMVETRGTRHELTHWDNDQAETSSIACPYGQPGDLLWVREAWKAHPQFDHLPPRDIPQSHVWYMADDGYKAESRLRQAMFMPRWASRINLEITSLRVERLQDISEADARAEGIDYDPGEGGVFHVSGLAGCCHETAIGSYRKLWEQINGPESWATNPWVWVVEFTRTK